MLYAGVAKLVDAVDSKSTAREGVSVRLRSPVDTKNFYGEVQMKKKLFLALVCFFVAFSVFAAPKDKGPKVTLKNSTGFEVTEIYVSPANSDNWGDDYLVNTTLDDGDSLTITLPWPLSEVSSYDIQFIDIEEDSYTQFDVAVKNGSIIEMTQDDLDEEGEEGDSI